MCGFAGEFRGSGLDGDLASRRTVLQAMGRQLARRGPDDEQFYDDGLLSLVFRRLSVIDVAGGRQPLWNEDGTVLAAVNGEIYNHADIRARLGDRHRFASRSDAEVVVHLYEEQGAGLLNELSGMFALVIWDTRERRLVLARDRLGIKPLFYAQVGGRLLFASELKALLAHPDCPRDFDWFELERSRGMGRSNPTYVHGIEGLPGGHLMIAGTGVDPAPRAWWRIEDHFPAGDAADARDDASWIAAYGETLHDSVHRHLMSDVPVGLFLSGGIDSTLLAALAADAGQDLHCFTVVEDSTLEAGDVDEAARAADRLGFAYHPVRYDAAMLLDQLEFGLEAFEFLVWAVERPEFSPEWLLKHELHRYARTRVPELKVILLGQGADEFAGGYSQSMGREGQSWPLYGERLTGIHRDARRIDAGIPPWIATALEESYPPARDRAPSEFHRHMVFRIAMLQRYNLWHEDRTSSAQGIEARVPFLDHRLVELLASVPPGRHASLFFDKRIVREQLRRAAPFYPEDKLKVRFYKTGGNRSIPRLFRDLVLRVYPDFRDKYAGGPGRIFSPDRLDTHFRHLNTNPQATDQDVRDLLQCMAIAVFASMCESLPVTGPPPGVDPPSPLPAWTG